MKPQMKNCRDIQVGQPHFGNVFHSSNYEQRRYHVKEIVRNKLPVKSSQKYLKFGFEEIPNIFTIL